MPQRMSSNQIKFLAHIECYSLKKSRVELGTLKKVKALLSRQYDEGYNQTKEPLRKILDEQLELKGRLCGLVVVVEKKNKEQAQGVSQFWRIAYDTKDPKALAWVKKTLIKQKKILKSGAYLNLLPDQQPLLPLLKKMGFFIDTLQLAGPVSKMRRVLLPNGKLPPLPSHYAIRPFSKKSEINPMINCMRRAFLRYPEHGWFIAKPKFLRALRKRFNAYLESRPKVPTIFLMTYKEEIVGHFSYQMATRKFAVNEGGLDVCLLPEHIGKGLARVIYAVLAKEMSKQKVKIVVGNSANPAVLAMAQKFDRKLVLIALRNSDVRCNQRRFSPFLK